MLSPALQIGVTLGGLAVLVVLALATYNAISGRLDLIDQQRALAALSAQATQAQAAHDQLATLQQRSAEAAAENARLTTALAAAGDDSAARAEVATLQTELADSTAKNQELLAMLDQARGALATEAARSRELEDLRAQQVRYQNVSRRLAHTGRGS